MLPLNPVECGGEQLDRLVQREAAATPRLEAHAVLGSTLFYLGDYAAARTHVEQGIGFCRKVRFLGKIQQSCIRNSMTYRLQNSRKSNFATEPGGLLSYYYREAA